MYDVGVRGSLKWDILAYILPKVAFLNSYNLLGIKAVFTAFSGYVSFIIQTKI